MKKQSVIIAIAAGLLAVLSAQQQSYAQYGEDGVGLSEETVQKCVELQIPAAQCSENAVLLKERMNRSIDYEGSGTPMFARESGQMILIIGTLGAIFGGIAGGFFVMGRKAKKIESA